MNKQDIDDRRIRSIELFASISETHLSALLEALSIESLRPRVMLFREGTQSRKLYILVEGTVELFSDFDSRTTLGVIHSAQPCSLASIFTGRYLMSARTLARSLVLSVPSRAVQELVKTDRSFACAVMAKLAGNYELLIDDLRIHKLRSSSDRVRRWIQRWNGPAGASGSFVLPCNKRTLASYLGMTPESLSRNFSRLAAENVMINRRAG
jgi:CRP/FNR family transcriptional activator FtrB